LYASCNEFLNRLEKFHRLGRKVVPLSIFSRVGMPVLEMELY